MSVLFRVEKDHGHGEESPDSGMGQMKEDIRRYKIIKVGEGKQGLSLSTKDPHSQQRTLRIETLWNHKDKRKVKELWVIVRNVI